MILLGAEFNAEIERGRDASLEPRDTPKMAAET